MARSSNQRLSASVRSEFGDKVGFTARNKKPLVLGERTKENAEAYDAIKGNEEGFQKLITIMAKWQDNVGYSEKIAFKDAYDELPESVKKLITEPRETMKILKRGINDKKSDLIEKIKESYQNDYDRLKDPDDEEAVDEIEREEQKHLKDFKQASSINGWSPSIEQALKFGDYILTSDEVEDFDAIVSTEKLEKIMKSVFTPESISEDYVGGYNRMWASREKEYIVMGVRLSKEAEELELNFRNKNSDMISKLKDKGREYGS